MAAQAGIRGLLRCQRKEGDDGGLSAMCLHVLLTGSVAAFTTRILGRLFSAGHAFEMRVLVELEPDVRMACLADHASHELLCARFSLTQQAENEQKKQ